jgi:hypothetical protein
MMTKKYVSGYSDLRSVVWQPHISIADRVEYTAITTNWLPPKYKIVKLVNGGIAETLIEGVSLEVAKGYIKLLGK